MREILLEFVGSVQFWLLFNLVGFLVSFQLAGWRGAAAWTVGMVVGTLAGRAMKR